MEVSKLIAEVTIKDTASAVADRVTAAMTKMADAEVKSTRQLEAQARGFEKLQASIDPIYAKMQRFANVQMQVNSAVDRGIATQNEADRVLARLNQQTTRSGLAFQNASYQVTDFFVQVQAGQSPLRAFVQQGSQLLQVFGPWGAVAAAAITIGGTLASTFLGLEDATKKATAAEEAHSKALERSRDLYTAIRGEAEQTTQLRMAELRTIVQQAEAENRLAQARLSSTSPTVRGAGRVPGTVNPDYVQAQKQADAALKYVQQQRAILDAALDDYDARLTSSFADFGKGSNAAAPALPKTHEIVTAQQTAAIRDQSSALADLLLQMNQAVALQQEDARTRQMTTAVIQAQAAAARDYSEGLRDSPIATADEVARVQALAARTYDLAEAQRKVLSVAPQITRANQEQIESWSALNNYAHQFGNTIFSAFENAIINGDRVSNVLAGLGQDLERLGLRILEDQALQLLFGGGFGSAQGAGFLGWAVNGIGSLFGGGDLSLGSLNAVTGMLGHAAGGGYIEVGENGPERFYPNVSGTIYPTGTAPYPESGGGGGMVVNNTINISGSSGTPQQNQDLADRMQRGLAAAINDTVDRRLSHHMRSGNMLRPGISA